MAVLDPLRGLAGQWTGRKQVLLPGEAPHESPSSLSIAPVVGDKFVQLMYSWAFDGTPQEGVLLVGYEPAEEAVTAVWADSWHMGDALMLCRGQAAADGGMVARGSYRVAGSPDWGWRIVLQPGDGALRIEMYNVAPDGAELPGVVAQYTRGS